MAHVTFQKPLRGSFLLERRERRAELKAHEQREMQAAKKRDGGKCRWPGCTYGNRNIPTDACHMTHRGQGGNPAGDRTQRKLIVSFCRIHHGQYDRCDIDAQPINADLMADGPLMFFTRSESGRMELIASERVLGVSVARGA